MPRRTVNAPINHAAAPINHAGQYDSCIRVTKHHAMLIEICPRLTQPAHPDTRSHPYTLASRVHAHVKLRNDTAGAGAGELYVNHPDA